MGQHEILTLRGAIEDLLEALPDFDPFSEVAQEIDRVQRALDCTNDYC